MIFTDRTITVKKGVSSIDDSIVLYRGDKEVEIRFTLNESSPFRFGIGAEPNIIEKTEAAYGQLIIKRPNDLPAVFSEIAPTNEGKIVFTITAEMIDEITEVGNYTFQIRLLDESMNSRATLPEVVNGIEIREPIALEDVSTTNEVNVATVGYALTTAGTTEDAFDTQGNYNKTTWGTGDRITATKLNKIEAGIDGVNKKVANVGGSGEVDLTGYAKTEDIPTRVSQLTNDANYVNTTQMNEAIANVTGQTIIEPEELDMPKVFFYGTALPTSKTDVNLTMDYVSNTTKFSSYIKLKCQGNSSMSYAKKNFTINMYSDEARSTKLKKDFKGWGAQSKFCLKANYVDTTHTRNISGARIAYDMVASRPDSPFKQQLLQCPRNGAVDGFPIKLYFNGEFYGIYTWNIPKDAWMFNMDKNNPNHCVLCAEQNNNGNMNTINSCQFRKVWNGSGDWSVEVGTASANIKASFDRCINFVMTATDDKFKTNIGEYFDLYSLLDYYCFSYLTCHLDGLAKNMLMATYDGVIWGASLYDMDSIYGVSWNGANYVATNYQCPEQYQETNSLLWQRIEANFGAELYARYLELRQGALSLSNIVKHVEEIYDVIPDRVFADEKAKWTNLPQVNTNTMTRFRNYMRDRAVYVDAQMLEIGTKVPCTGIVLSVDTLSFTTTDTQTLSVVVSPTNCTDTVTWSVSPTGVVSVNNGVVTPITNGSCTITATCGTQSATCAVTVSGISESGGDEVRNAWESATWEEKYYNDDGNLTSYDVIHHSSLIPVNGDEIITVECDASVATPYLRISYFNSNKEYIGYNRGFGYNTVAPTNPNLIAVDLTNESVNIAYVSINANTSDKSLLTVSSYSTIDVSTSYVNGNINRNSNAVTNGTAGTVTENSVDITSDYIDCSNGIKISVSDTTHMIGAVAYNENKEYLATYDGANKIWHSEGYDDSEMCSNLLITTFPDTAKYIRFTVGGCTNSSLITVKVLRISGDTPSGGNTGDYTDISYIESTGTQYINTRIVPTTSTKIELVAEMSASKTYDHIFGSDNFMKVQWNDDTGTAIYANKKNGQSQVSGLTLGKHTYVMDMTDTANVITIDGTKRGNIIGQVESTTYPLLLLSGYNNGTIETEFCGVGKIYSCKIYYEDTLVANMKPVLTNSGTYGLLDTVNNTFYGSEVGSFTGGGTPSGGDTGIYATAEYAITEPRAFNGTSDYIDTGIKLFDTAKDFAVFVDYTETGNVPQTDQATVFHCLHEERPYRGLCLMQINVNSSGYMIGGQAVSTAYLNNIPSLGNHKYLIQFTNGTIASIKTIDTSNNIIDCTLGTTASSNPYVQVTENLLLGCYQDTSGNKDRFWSGTINKFGVWYKQLTENEINQVFGKSGGGTDISSL